METRPRQALVFGIWLFEQRLEERLVQRFLRLDESVTSWPQDLVNFRREETDTGININDVAVW